MRASRPRTAAARLLAEDDGFTLIEMMVVLAILGVVVASMTTLFSSASNAQIDQSSRVQAQQNARLALDALRREIHCAGAIAGTPPTASITVTLGPYCSNGGTTLTGPALPIPSDGLVNATVSAANTSAFPAAGTIYIGTSGPITCAGKTPTSFTLCSGGIVSGGVAVTYATGAAITATTTFTWCTKDKNGNSPPAAAVPPPYSLWRFLGSSCSGTGHKWADYLTDSTGTPSVAAGQVFTVYTAAVTGNLLALTVALPVDVTPNNTNQQRYTVSDDIALRNTPRS